MCKAMASVPDRRVCQIETDIGKRPWRRIIELPHLTIGPPPHSPSPQKLVFVVIPNSHTRTRLNCNGALHSETEQHIWRRTSVPSAGFPIVSHTNAARAALSAPPLSTALKPTALLPTVTTSDCRQWQSSQNQYPFSRAHGGSAKGLSKSDTLHDVQMREHVT